MLRNRLPEVEIPEGNPFQYDKLKREPCANTFLSILKMYSATGCVVALSGEWGSGKTTFIRMLMQKMKNEGGHPLYFNAWENDYVSDPLIALLAGLKDLYPQSSKWNDVITSGGKIIASIATSAVKTLAKNKLGIDPNVIDAGVDEAGKLLKDDIEEFSKQKTTFAEFRKALQSYIAENTTEDFPVVFFVDELDRCSPRFSVLVLERIKHLFDIPNVVFVLSVNKKQLEYAIQGYYGSAGIDASNYLRRFVDIEYSLPRPKGEDFCQYLYDLYGFDEIFNHKERRQYYEFSSDADSFQSIAKILLSFSKIDLRTADKIFAHTRLALMEFGKNSYIVPDVFFLLCFLKIVNPTLYHNIVEEKYNAQQLLNELEDFFPQTLLVMGDYNSSWKKFTYTMASFIFMYTLDENAHERERIITSNDGKANNLNTKYLDAKFFGEALAWYYGKRYQGEIPLRFITQRIELGKTLVSL